jgi:hypothetical protein
MVEKIDRKDARFPAGPAVSSPKPKDRPRFVKYAGFRFMDDQPEQCMAGHDGFWGSRRRGRMVDIRCCWGEGSRRCWVKLTRTDGGGQGFLAPGRVVPKAYEVKNWLLISIFNFQYRNDGAAAQIPDIRAGCPTLTDGQLHGALDRSCKSEHLIKSSERFPLPIAGSSFAYQLTHRGQAYVRVRRAEIEAKAESEKAVTC